ncbi:MAG: histidine kinase [Clostridia bacterium]|nr:histidine kinase [Clostridia bacterium]
MKGRMRMAAWLNNISIFKKLMLSFLVLSLIPIVCIGVISYTLTYRTMHRDLSSSITINQQRIAETINGQLTDIDGFLSEKIYDRQFQQQVRAHAGGMVTDAAVQQSCAQIVADANLPIRVTDAVYIPARRDDSVPLRPSTSEDYRLSVSRQEETLYFTKAVCNLYTEQVLGELRISVSLLSFLDEYLQMDREEYGFLLFDEQGNKVFANWNITVDTGRPTAAFMANQPTGSCTVNGERYITAREDFPVAGWVLYCFVPQRLLQTQVNAILLTTVTTVLICSVAVLLLSLFVAYSMTVRLNVMVGRMKTYRVDDTQMPVRDDLGGDEIGQLSEFFDLMSQRNARLIEEVYKSKLEQQEMEQRALQAQIKPHFLYNCLDNINIRALMLGDDQISNVVTMLADFYRTSLNKGRSATSVSNEIKNVKSYLSLLTAMGGKGVVDAHTVEIP